jgi:tripartite-type tricarboxylate transporter receptor subunit TctC
MIVTRAPAVNWQHAALALTLSAAAGSALAQAYPSRPVRVIVPFASGGNTDLTARPLATKLGEAMGQSFLVDNRPGATTIVGAEITAKATPDGHTLLLAAQNTLCINPYSYSKLPYDPNKDFAPIAMLTDYKYAWVARNSLPVKNIPEMVVYAKANPGKLSHASIGEGSSGHLAQILFEGMAGIKMIHVPYKGNTPMIADLLGGNVDTATLGPASVISLVKAGKVKMLAMGSDKRMPDMPDMPTVAEAGYAGFTVGTWVGMVTQKAVPKPIIDRLNREINRALQSPEVRQPLEGQMVTLGNGTPEDLAKRIAFEQERWSKVVKSINLKFD